MSSGGAALIDEILPEDFIAIPEQNSVAQSPRHGLKEPLELYDLSTDEGETKNVASANPHVVQRMEEYLAQPRTDSLEYPAS